jgi:signal transduction histidine kinase
MKNLITNEPFESRLMKHTWLIVVLWTFILFGILLSDLDMITKTWKELATTEARTHFNKDKAFRFWAASHGGFYVPVTEKTSPNPYLEHLLERDIETPSGLKLTLMNPAWALRQINDEFSEEYGAIGDITSLKPLNPINQPDDWQREALLQFEENETELLEFSQLNENQYLRLMQPLVTQKGCLKCHKHQGYKIGDIRGGVSVSVPLSTYIANMNKIRNNHLIIYLAIWFLGFGTIIQSSRVIKKNIFKRELVLLNESNQQLKENGQLLATSKERLKLLNKIIRHDLANDFAVIKSATLIYKKTSNTNMFKEIEKRIEKSLETIASYKKFEKSIDSNINLEEIEISVLLSELIKIYPKLEFKIEGKGRVYADNALFSVFTNLITNSINHGNSTQVNIKIHIDNNNCSIVYSDNGSGIKDSIKNKIFNEGFFHGETGNTGIGLFIVKQTIENYGGSITVEDNQPSGAKFVITLRRAIANNI